jgi:fructose/tagatose bisphosphate aldolase
MKFIDAFHRWCGKRAAHLLSDACLLTTPDQKESAKAHLILSGKYHHEYVEGFLSVMGDTDDQTLVASYYKGEVYLLDQLLMSHHVTVTIEDDHGNTYSRCLENRKKGFITRFLTSER